MKLVVALILCGACGPALADIAGAVNDVRTSGCDGKHQPAPALRVAARLADAARRLARGSDLNAALRGARYRALQSTSIHIRTPGGEEAVRRLLTEKFCSAVTDPAFRDVGTETRGDEVWIILATAVPPAPRNAAQASGRILALVNQARREGRRCGGRQFDPAPALKQAAALEQAALAHSRDMARHDKLSHTGSDGSTVSERVARTGYKWRVVGENVAAGRMTPDEVTEGWLKSTVHCENIMDPRFSEIGIAFAERRGGSGTIYWTQVFAAPR